MKIRLWRIGLAMLLVGAGPPLGGGAALATSISDLSAIGAPRLNSRRGAAGNLAVPMAAGDAVGKDLRLLNRRRVPARRINGPEQPHLGVDDLIGFMIDADRYGTTGFNIRFNLDRRQTLDWMRFWTDIAFSPETEQWFDYRAIAQAAYRPEIRYWLDGGRWASFDTALPRHGAAGGAVQAGAGDAVQAGAGAGPNTAVGPKTYAAGNNFSAAAPKQKAGPIQAKSLREFLLSIGSKIIRQPIVYVILLVFLGVLFVRARRPPRTYDIDDA